MGKNKINLPFRQEAGFQSTGFNAKAQWLEIDERKKRRQRDRAA
jgi:hypothetical protein